MRVSDKYVKYYKDINEKNLDKLSKDGWFRNFFEIKYLDLFFYYYNDELPLKEVSLFDKEIILSGKTKSLFWLLQKNKDLKENIIQVIKKSYLTNNNKD